MSEEIRFVEGEFQRVVVESDDTIVLTYPGLLSDSAYRNIKKIGEGAFPGHKILVLEEGMKIGAIGCNSV